LADSGLEEAPTDVSLEFDGPQSFPTPSQRIQLLDDTQAQPKKKVEQATGKHELQPKPKTKVEILTLLLDEFEHLNEY